MCCILDSVSKNPLPPKWMARISGSWSIKHLESQRARTTNMENYHWFRYTFWLPLTLDNWVVIIWWKPKQNFCYFCLLFDKDFVASLIHHSSSDKYLYTRKHLWLPKQDICLARSFPDKCNQQELLGTRCVLGDAFSSCSFSFVLGWSSSCQLKGG